LYRRFGSGWVQFFPLVVGWVGLGQSDDGLGWIGSHEMDPRTTASAIRALFGAGLLTVFADERQAAFASFARPPVSSVVTGDRHAVHALLVGLVRLQPVAVVDGGRLHRLAASCVPNNTTTRSTSCRSNVSKGPHRCIQSMRSLLGSSQSL